MALKFGLSFGLRAVNGFYDLWTGGQQRPVFFDPRHVCPQLLELDQNYPAIKKEFEALLAQSFQAMPRYHEIDSHQQRISATTLGDWKVFVLAGPGLDLSENRAQCPETSRLLDRIPSVTQAFFSILDPKKHIPPHCGPYRGFLRYHLALRVPSDKPPSIRVKDQYYQWQEGKSVMFDDSHEHEVINESEEIRAVLIVDVFRPMPLLPRLVNVGLTRFFLAPFYFRRLYAGRTKLKALD